MKFLGPLSPPLDVASGGTGSAATPAAGGAAYGTGTALATTAAGIGGQVFTSNGASAPSWQTSLGGAPSGVASGSLAGTYPAPTIAALAVTDAEVATANKDGLVGTYSLRTLGTGSQQAAAGNDSRLSDARTPTAHNQTASTITDFFTAADARVVAGITGKADLASPTFTGVVGGISASMVGLGSVDNTSDISKVPVDSVVPTRYQPRTNIGSPSVLEVGMIDAEATNKLWFYDTAKFLYEDSPDDVNWTTRTVASNDTALLVSGRSNANFVIAKGSCLRITIDSFGYVFLNWLYAYTSTNGGAVYIKIEARQSLSNVWTTSVPYGNSFNNWPGHVYLPHDSIAFLDSADDGHYDKVRVTFKTAADTTGGTYPNFNLSGLEWWGGYPSGKRTIYDWDQNQNVQFPAAVSAAGQALVATNDSRLSDARTPVAHNQTASTITDFSTAADARVVAGITGKVDSTDGRLSDARTPVAHNQTASTITDFSTAADERVVAGIGGKANLASPTFTGTVGGISASMVGLGSVDNTSDVSKPVSTAQAAADTAAKARANHTGTQGVATITGLGGAATLGVGTTIGTVAAGDDSRFNTGAPTGPAGGSLTGTYPNPTVAGLAITDLMVASANKDGVAGTYSLRTLGAGAQQATAGNDGRLSDARTPVAHNQTASTITDFSTAADARVVAGITGKVDTSDARLSDARTPVAHNQSAATINSGVLGIAQVPTGTTGITVPLGNDSRFSDTRTPTALSVTSGTIVTGGLPTSAITGTAVVTADGRLSDARTPVAHNQTASTISDFSTAADARVVAGITGKVDTGDARLSDVRTPTDGSVTLAKITVGGLSPSAITGTAVVTADARLSDARTPLAHNQTSATITDFSTAADARITAAGLVGTGDSRLSDARTPTAHNQDASTITTGTLPIARGGNNSAAAPTAGGSAYGDGAGYAFTAAGIAGQVLTSNAGAAPTWKTGGSPVDVQTFTANGTWTKPAGVLSVYVLCVGSGGGGSGGIYGYSGGGGAGGAQSFATFTAASLSSTASITVPAGGTGSIGSVGFGTTTQGGAGGNSLFGTYLQSNQTTTGGGAVTSAPGTGGTTVLVGGTDQGTAGGAGGSGVGFAGVSSIASRGATGGGGGGNGSSVGGAGGRSNMWGTNGGAGGTTGIGSDGGSDGAVGTGGGGGGSQNPGAGGNGGKGGLYGGGGGGGGSSSSSSYHGGDGGNGGNGVVMVISW